MEDKPYWAGHDAIDGFVGKLRTAASIDKSAADLVGRRRLSRRFDT